MAVRLADLANYCDQLLNTGDFDDYCPNGLQVDSGTEEIKRVVSGVTANQALIEAAVELKADLLLVHHGYFWKGETPSLIGLKGKRVRTLMQEEISMLAYHLPLDAHAQLGNNRRLGDLLGFSDVAPLTEKSLLWRGKPIEPLSPEELGALLSETLGREALHIPGGRETIQQIGWSTGAAQSAIEQAVFAGCDAFISGEISEQTVHLARELGIHYYSAGHHATERYGVQALGEHLAEQFGIEHRFVDIANPV